MYKWIRRLSVGRRIAGGFLFSVALLALSIPFVMKDHKLIYDRLQHVTKVDSRADRLLLLSSRQIESSRVNIMRYLEDLVPSHQESLNDISQAAQLLTEAEGLMGTPEQRSTVAGVIKSLGVYEALIRKLGIKDKGDKTSEMRRLEFMTLKTGNDIGLQIESIVEKREDFVAEENRAANALAQRSLNFLAGGYAGVVLLSLLIAGLLGRSITKPIAELRNGTESFREGKTDVVLPVEGSDELSLLARTFNQMGAELHQAKIELQDHPRALEEELTERKRVEAELQRHQAHLQELVEERTVELHQEISERKQAEEVLQATLQRFYTLLSSLYAGLLLVAEDNSVEFVNQAFCDLFNLKDAPEDLRGLAVAELIDHNSFLDPDNAIARIREIVARGQPVKCEEVPMNGGRTCLRDYVPLQIDGKNWGRLWYYQDITGLKEAQQEVVARERMVLAMSQAVDDALVMLDSQGRVRFWNLAAENLFGYSFDEAKGLDFHELAAPPEDRAKARSGIAKFARTGEGAVFGSRMETRAINRGGELFPVEVSLSSFRVDNDWFAVGTVRNITQGKKAEEELKQYVDELERFNRVVVGREGKMIQLKKEINELREHSGLGAKYKIAQ